MKIKTVILSLFAVFALAISPVSFADEGDERHQENFVPYPLIHASTHGDIAEVKRLLAADANPNGSE